MGGTTIPRHVSSEEGNNKIQISPVVYISHHWQSSLLHYPSNSVDQAILPRSLRLDAWLGWLEDDEMKVLRTFHKSTTTFPLLSQLLLPSWWCRCLVHANVFDRFDLVSIPDQWTPRSHFATAVSHFIDISIHIHKSLHFQFSTPHFSMCQHV